MRLDERTKNIYILANNS
ncbi:MAG: hypothetical protein AB3A66_16545 [Nodularia sp. CChRGM 3473]